MTDPAGTAAPPPIGVILAGGAGRRIGASKATVRLHGIPLIHYPLAALQAVLRDVAVIAKAESELPALLAGVPVWIESSSHRHPLTGIVEALRRANGRPILVCAVDLPFVTPQLVKALAGADAEGRAAVVVSHAGALQPLLARYEPASAPPLTAALRDRGVSVRAAVAALHPATLEVEDAQVLLNINTPDDLVRAAALLEERYPNVKS